MKISRHVTLFAFGLLLATCSVRGAETARYLDPASFTEPIRVACVGDSITYGAGMAERERNCYPAILAQCLGERRPLTSDAGL